MILEINLLFKYFFDDFYDIPSSLEAQAVMASNRKF